jgi:TENA/THI-4/PQQC family protein/beta-lactamase family protein
VGGDPPRYLYGSDAQPQATGFAFRDGTNGGVVTYVPGLARMDDCVLARFASSDLILVDGTFWRDDELPRLGISARAAREMGHVPLSGPGGTLEVLARLRRPRTALIHINNTNPILLEDSPERMAVLRWRRGGLRRPGDNAMTPTAALPTSERCPGSPEAFVAQLRAQGARYHNLHPFHSRMDAGLLTREELQRWVTNRFYYQRCIPLKDAAILANCSEVAVRREWIRRIIDHDGTADGTGGIESWLRLGEALGLPREALLSERHVLPAVRYAVDAYVNFARQKPGVEAVASSLSSCSGRLRFGCVLRHSNGSTSGSTRRGSNTSAQGSYRRHATRSTPST